MIFTQLLFLLALPCSISSHQEQQQCDASDGKSCTPDQSESSEPRLPDDFVDPCQNKNENCAKWAAEGECRNNPNFLLSNCALSCGSCHAVEGWGEEAAERTGQQRFLQQDVDKVCGDEFERCGEWAAEGECSINTRFMQFRCKYSCWKCMNTQKDRELGLAEDVISKKSLYINMEAGKHQIIRDTLSEEDKKKVRATLIKMDHYEKYTMTNPSVNRKARERCRNDFPMCAEWAMRGMCLNSNLPLNVVNNEIGVGQFDGGKGEVHDGIFMMNVCPLACGMCQELEPFHKCTGKRHPWAQPLFGNGDLNAFLEGKRNPGSDWARFEPLFVSYPNARIEGREGDPYVVVLKKFLSDDEVDHLRSMGSGIGWDQSVRDDPKQNAKYAGRARCHDSGYCDNDEIYQRIMHRISSLTHSPQSHFEPMEIDLFHSSEEHEGPIQHNFEVTDTFKPAGPRVLSLFLFLSNTEEGGGGELGFPHLDLFIRPKKGMAVLWPNVKDNNLLEADPLTSYEHFPVRNGGAEAFVGSHVHVMLHNWTDANIRGCA